jgi:hypothetical protein
MTPHPSPIGDTVGAWVPHGRFVRHGAPGGPLAGLIFGVKTCTTSRAWPPAPASCSPTSWPAASTATT